MPVYEFRCAGCGAEFEKLMFNRSSTVSCPSCETTDVERKHSSFGMGGQGRTSSSCSGCSKGSCAGCSSG